MRRLVRRTQGLRTTQRRDGHLAGAATRVGEHGKGIRIAFGGCLATARRAADADDRHRRGDGHGPDIGLGDLPGNEGEHARGEADRRLARLGAGVVDHLVDGHPALFGQRKN